MVSLDETYVASIAGALNAANVPCVLWGHCLMMVHGIPTILGTIDYVVPDRLLLEAAESLRKFPHLVPCQDPNGCIDSSHCDDRHTPPPASHMHLDDDLDVTVTLYLQSQTLWFLPRLEISLLDPLPSTLPPEYQLASDQVSLPPWRPGRGPGFFKSAEVPVVVVKSHVLLEAFLRLYARDCDETIGTAGIPLIGYITQYVHRDGLLDSSRLPRFLEVLYHQLLEEGTGLLK